MLTNVGAYVTTDQADSGSENVESPPAHPLQSGGTWRGYVRICHGSQFAPRNRADLFQLEITDAGFHRPFHPVHDPIDELHFRCADKNAAGCGAAVAVR